MGLWERIRKDFKGNARAYWFALAAILSTIAFFVCMAIFGATRPEIYWFAAVAVLLFIFFFVDLAFYYAWGEGYTLSATLRGRFAFVTMREAVIGIAALLAGIWLSHLFQFGANPRVETETIQELKAENETWRAYTKQLQDANSNLKRELKAKLDERRR